MTDAEIKIGYTFKNKKLLENALAHSSYANEMHTSNNERLEFLGDSVLGIIISEYLFKRANHVNEGSLSRLRATLVCEASLAEVAKKISLPDIILLGKGEERTGGRKRPSVVSDAFEAVLGAIYLDSNLDTARKWVLKIMSERIELALSGGLYSDYKTKLQEVVQSDGKSTVTYTTIGDLQTQSPNRFTVQVEINGKPKATASGSGKKEAEQRAAKALLEKMGK